MPYFIIYKNLFFRSLILIDNNIHLFSNLIIIILINHYYTFKQTVGVISISQNILFLLYSQRINYYDVYDFCHFVTLILYARLQLGLSEMKMLNMEEYT